MEQELSPAQFMPEAPVKRGRGRPRKPDTELSAKTLANRQTEANRLARIEHGRVIDEHLKAEIESLRPELSMYSKYGGYDSERYHVESFIDQGYELLRSIGYDLKSIQMMDEQDINEMWESQFNTPIESWTHMSMFPDSSADEQVWHCHQVHLTPALVRFEIKVLEAVLQWGTENPANFEHRSALEKELEARKRGEDT